MFAPTKTENACVASSPSLELGCPPCQMTISCVLSSTKERRLSLHFTDLGGIAMLAPIYLLYGSFDAAQGRNHKIIQDMHARHAANDVQSSSTLEFTEGVVNNTSAFKRGHFSSPPPPPTSL